MNAAEEIRAAAARMRARAEAATPGPWTHGHEGLQGGEVVRARDVRVTRVYVNEDEWRGCPNAEHIASWHPDVALAVADCLDAMAARAESKIAHGGDATAVWSHEIHALTVARTYLGTGR